MIGYIGPGSGLELVPTFMSLIAWMVMAFSAILLYPFYALIRFFRGTKVPPNPAGVNQPETPASTPMLEPVPEKSLAITTQPNP